MSEYLTLTMARKANIAWPTTVVVSIVGLDDTDSRSRGMCTTYVAARVAQRLRNAGRLVGQIRLVRLNPAVERKTRGNAALAVPTTAPSVEAFEIARDTLETLALAEEPRTSPGVVVADVDARGTETASTPEPPDRGASRTTESDGIPADVVQFAHRALREQLTLEETLAILERHDWHHAGYPTNRPEENREGRGRIGGLAAIGAIAAFDDWTYEHISYRHPQRRGTARQVDHDSVYTAAERGYPTVWDTVDHGEGEPVCVPAAPGPILHGIRGDDPEACRAVARQIVSEPIERATTFRTNQGTDAHLKDGRLGSLDKNAGYCIEGTVESPPETRRGGHVFFDLAGPTGGSEIECVAFEPTKRFRTHVRALRPGDELTVCGEHEDGTVKLEKFALRQLVRTERVNPTCPDCGRSMSSAGRDQGYRCRDCGTASATKTSRRLQRALERGWYEVPPCARRHIAKPLVRGGFDAATHTEQ